MARAALNAARSVGVGRDAVMLVARSDIELDAISNDYKEADSDSTPAAIKGVIAGGVTGLLLDLTAVVLTPMAPTLAGVGIAALAGASIGGMAATIFGAALPDPVRQAFRDEIKAGRILLVTDTDNALQQIAGPVIEATGATRLPFEHATLAVR
ncbi:hypothetical protein FW784_01760 [Lysobacter lacus]|uniref:DUF1269 domain-containing protein n=2 Tax=Cognatilysobacter lacus TaxID=1643323 RepID=A0A5D8ZFG7_9GAMM|nr:hypothetical protein FW784_01760 [Lysobacter lacus]